MQGNAVTFKRILQRDYLTEMSYGQPYVKIYCLNTLFACEKNYLAVELMCCMLPNLTKFQYIVSKSKLMIKINKILQYF